MITISGVAMLRIGQGINKNGEVLRKVAAVIGDKDIPSVGKWYKSVAFWISWTMVVLGAGCLLTAFSLSQQPMGGAICRYTKSSSATTTTRTKAIKTISSKWGRNTGYSLTGQSIPVRSPTISATKK